MKAALRKIRETNHWNRIKRNGHFNKQKKTVFDEINRIGTRSPSRNALWMHNYTTVTGIRTVDSENIKASEIIEKTEATAPFNRTVLSDSELSQSIGNEHFVLTDEASEIGLNNIDSEASGSVFSNIDIVDSEASENVGLSNNKIFDEISPPIQESLKGWAIKYQIKHNAINELLSMLRQKCPELPIDARTLVQTPRTTIISMLNGSDGKSGKYWHYGLKKILTEVLLATNNHQSRTLHLSVNIDGLPMFRSSSNSFWPILVEIEEFKKELPPLIVGIYCGKCELI